MSEMSKKPLSNERIIQSAFTILDAKGEKGLSMRSLASTLNVEAASLYNHIPNKGALIQQIVDSIYTKIKIINTESWTKTLRVFATNCREVLLMHPGAVPLVATTAISNEVGERLSLPLIQAMAEIGATHEEMLFIIQSITVFVIGHALAEVGNWPNPPIAISSYYNQWFDKGITALIDGFALQYKSR